MVKYLTALIAVIMLAGCASTPNIKLTTKAVPVGVPLLYCPAPPKISRPALPVTTIKSSDSDGVVAKKYAASIVILIGYSKELEKIVNHYNSVNQAYAAQRKKLIKNWEKKTGTNISVPIPAEHHNTNK